MKKILKCLLALLAVTLINGCFLEAYWVASTALTAKSAYNVCESIRVRKHVNDRTSLSQHYRKIFVSINVQPKQGSPEAVNRICERVYSQTINEMAKESGVDLVSIPHDAVAMQSQTDAVVIQVEEKAPSLWKRIVSEKKIHATVDYIDKRTAKSFARENYDGVAGNYEEMIDLITRRTFLKIARPGLKQESWLDAIRRLGTEIRLVETLSEKEVLINS